MKAAIVTAHGLSVEEVPIPKPGSREILVKIGACPLNRADLGVIAGHHHGSVGGIGAIPGIEWAGEIVEAGANVQNFRVGDRVMCGGTNGYAEYAVTDWGRAMPIPAPTMSYAEAATLPIALNTMHDALVTNGLLQKGQAVLIQGASSGVGLMALQIAKFMGAGLVIGSSTNAGRRARLAEFGADLAIDTSQKGWSDEVLKATGGKGVDVIIDQVSASVANENLRATKVLGRIVNVGRLGGTKGEFDFDLHAARRITYVGVTFRTRSPEEIEELTRRTTADLWPAILAGKFRIPTDRIYRLAEVREAVAHMKANQHFGKIVMVP
jgi:NADPH2:quinone reductase